MWVWSVALSYLTPSQQLGPPAKCRRHSWFYSKAQCYERWPYALKHHSRNYSFPSWPALTVFKSTEFAGKIDRSTTTGNTRRFQSRPTRHLDGSYGLRNAGRVLGEREIPLHGFVVSGNADTVPERPVLVETLVFVIGRRSYVVAEIHTPVVCKKDQCLRCVIHTMLFMWILVYLGECFWMTYNVFASSNASVVRRVHANAIFI